MTTNEAFDICRKTYHSGDIVHCVHGGSSSTRTYVAKMDYLRTVAGHIVCDDVNGDTPFITLYNSDHNLFAPIFMAASDPRRGSATGKALHRTEIVTNVVNLVHQLDKYDKIGSIIGGLQKYQKEETLLDVQLRNFKNK